MIGCALRSVAVCPVTGLAAPVPALAQARPTKTVMVVVPFGPGNALETNGRPVLEQLSQRLGFEPMKMSPEQFAAFFREDIEDLARSMKVAGISAN
jgi:tripartite-type tricarboxylate transporter receptor subunit TctC